EDADADRICAALVELMSAIDAQSEIQKKKDTDADRICAELMDLRSAILAQSEIQRTTNKLFLIFSYNLEVDVDSIDKLTEGLARRKPRHQRLSNRQKSDRTAPEQ